MALSLWVFDVFAAVVLSATALFGAYLPVVFARNGKATGERSLSFVLGNMLSAGVMIAAGFCHLLGDAIDVLEKNIKYPLAPFLCACGFMATIIADQIVEHATHHEDPTPVLGDGELLILNSVATGSNPHQPHQHHCFGAAVSHFAPSGKSPRHVRTVSQENGSQRQDEHPESETDEEEGSGRRRPGRSLLVQQQKAQRTDSNGIYESPGSEAGSEAWESEEQGSALNKRRPPQVSFLTACLMAVALCFHSLLEGAALGAQPDVVNSLHIFVAIQAHKGLAAYALGSSIVDSQAEARQFWSVIATFAFATPVGIGLGFILSSVTTSMVAGAISALASGTFLYVAFMEVLPRELSNPAHRLSKLGMLVLGFGLMALLAIWA